MITFPKNTREIINEIRNEIGRDVTFVFKVKTDCPSCDINPVTDTSTDPYCTTCSGTGYVYTISGYTTIAHITWGKSMEGWYSGGFVTEGDCKIQVENISGIENIIDTCNYVIVDDKQLTVNKKLPRGVTEINRYLVDLVLQGDN